MLSINKVMITGRLTRDPETKYLPSGQALTNLGVAVSRRFQDKNGEWRDEPVFLDIETWGKTAERAAETLRKGQPVYVEGRLKMDTWERDGVKQSKIRISADVVKSFDVPSRGGAGGEGGEYNEAAEGGESYGSAPAGAASARSSSGGERSAASSRTRPQQSGAPSDNLDFGDPNVQDDIPF